MPILGGVTSIKKGRTHVSIIYGTSDDGDGSTEWIKKAMGPEDGADDDSVPPSVELPEFGQDDISEMEHLIMSLSRESNDDKRREKLAGILDEELEEASKDSDDAALNAEVPRFAKLFQIVLDSVGEKVQSDAREAALEQQQKQKNESDGEDEAQNDSMPSEEGERVPRVKTPEELQLWALIDMMVQSKTRVKLHMGSLGSKGEFR